YLPVFADSRVLALRLVHEAVKPDAESGPMPFYRLPTPSASDETRFASYKSRRFRDNPLALVHLEYRQIVWKRLWAIALAQVGEVAPTAGAFTMSDVHESYGV